jgi:type IV pilus assembly protein PilE
MNRTFACGALLMTKRSESRGFSLVELMVVVAIIGIISAIAYPSYQSYMADTYRGQAIADLKVCSMALERYYSNDFTYVGAVVDDSAATVCPNESPTGGGAQFDLTLETATASAFTLQAKPVGASGCGGKCIQLRQDNTITEL